MLKTAVVTVSDRAHKGQYDDKSGAVIHEVLSRSCPDMDIQSVIVPDEREAIEEALERFADHDWIITTGGTGLGERDITPDVCADFCERPLPGIAEALRHESRKQTPFAMLSRGYAGQRGSTVVVNFPGSPRGAELCAQVVVQIMAHAVDMMHGKGHGHHYEET